MKNRIQLDDITTKVLDSIEEHGGKVYLVGGAVRDIYQHQNIATQDVDVEVYHLSITELQAILSSFGTVSEVGKSFGILKVSSLPMVDFALPREEVNTGVKHTDFEVVVDQEMDLRKATKRRDITINAMLYEYRTGEIRDFYHGKEDMDNGCIRMVHEETFTEDPLRVLRVARFVATYQFQVEEKTKIVCKQMVAKGQLATLSQERVYEEYSKLLLTNTPSVGFAFLNEIGALPNYLGNLQHTMQRLDYHPEGNVWNHTMLVIDIAALTKHKTSDPLSFMWSCLLHDIGKPRKTTPTGSAPKHQLAGVDVFEEQCTIITSKRMRKYIKTMIMYHMELMNMAKNNARDRVYYRLLKDIEGIFPLEDLIILTKCDKLGRLMDGSASISLLMSYIEDKMERLGTQALQPCIDGELLISLGYQPSRVFSKMLEEAYRLQIQGRNKEEIIKEIQRKY